MSLRVEKSPISLADFESQYRWYASEAGEAVAEAYLDALHATIELLAQHPALGRLRRFRHPLLRGFRSFRVAAPFQKHLLFYRHDDECLLVERVVHDARDLPQRLLEPPEG
jgi:toxin ParE1/3/4